MPEGRKGEGLEEECLSQELKRGKEDHDLREERREAGNGEEKLWPHGACLEVQYLGG